jgi:hypothetical protein
VRVRVTWRIAAIRALLARTRYTPRQDVSHKQQDVLDEQRDVLHKQHDVLHEQRDLLHEQCDVSKERDKFGDRIISETGLFRRPDYFGDRIVHLSALRYETATV